MRAVKKTSSTFTECKQVATNNDQHDQPWPVVQRSAASGSGSSGSSSRHQQSQTHALKFQALVRLPESTNLQLDDQSTLHN
eukprot:CAMPEP_0202808022 /NCGR_PEP_ID=MMETSP1389-20130828/649_1 /ASSEMBLY_ACC=CAM_ASM_000865 /TAXON_ID=302021 /ORGANISM="Rhodomonas sp., Strain CCMP768" /LENGTH=80 /DNA_ID=CAMNT_0049478203 /DNA_START=62 /DNA_END=301 /DNA_ORIENTATION=-